jgi:beta-galactosidase
MKKRIAYTVLSVFLATAAYGQSQSGRTIIPFDNDWKFFKGDAPGADEKNFNDASWRLLNVPHDWSIEGPYDRNNPTGSGGGYLPGGVGWYRKTFSITDATKKIFIEFDGIMANSDVWINGIHLGKRPNGYVGLYYELTKHLDVGSGKKNIIAVRADNTVQPASRWYTGAGIYRHVRLVSVNAVHVDNRSPYITASDVSGKGATVQVQTSIINQSSSVQNISLQTLLLAPDGKQVASVQSAKKINAGTSEIILQKTDVAMPALWNLENPQLYKVITKVFIDKKQVDEITTVFGIRDARFEAATGFWLNGKNIKIKGVCLHHDGGAVGAAVPLRIWEKRLQSLKDVGVNGIRTSHNAPAPEFLDLCDRMGFLVMDETFDTWNAKKNHAENGYNLYFTDWWERDTRDIVMRDRNHPCIVIYSIGNEIHDNLNDSTGFRKYKMQQDLVHSLDPTRPVTMALFRPGISHVYENGFANMMDVVGQNYRENELVVAHENNPQRKVIGTENRHEQAAWIPLRDKPFIAGQFLWTGYDYLGEDDWPNVAHNSGLFDKTGQPYNIAYQRQSWWNDKPMVFIMRREANGGAGDWISDWSPADIDVYDEARIQVFSNCDEVELFLNDKSMGTRSRPEDKASPTTWSVTFQKGTLKAVGKNHGTVVAQQELKTAGKPSKIILQTDKVTLQNNWDDVIYVTATVTDENGIPVLSADNKIKFDVKGPGFIAAVDNGDPSCSEPYSSGERWAYKGRCIAIIKANADAGTITVTANSDNLQEGSVNITAKK